MASIKELLDKVPAERRTLVVKLGVGSIVILIALASYFMSGKNEKKVVVTEEEVVMDLGEGMLEDDIRAVMDRNMEEQKLQNTATNQAISDLSNQMGAVTQVLSKLEGTTLDLAETQNKIANAPGNTNGSPSNTTDKTLPTVENEFKFPPPVPMTTANNQEAPFNPGGDKPLENTDPVLIGDIGHVQGVEEKKADSGKKKRGFYLAPGFSEAMLLTGLKAKTVEGAKDNPEPMVLRIQKPAILPNYVKADLKGCFVIANGYGSLASERVEARLVSLHCLSHDNQAVIDQRIKGFVVDADGSNGLKGIPVTKMGANMARVFLAGVLGGSGKAIQASATTTAISPQGTVSTLPNGRDVAMAGVGQGLADAADDVRKVFLDLVRQSAPVIEIGPTKKVTIMITEGVSLEIRTPNDFSSNEVSRGKRKNS